METSLCHMVAGMAAGGAATVVLHPLDLVKTRLQVQDRPRPRGANADVARDPALSTARGYRGPLDAAMRIVREEGVSVLYQGVGPNLVGAAASWGFYFMAYCCSFLFDPPVTLGVGTMESNA